MIEAHSPDEALSIQAQSDLKLKLVIIDHVPHELNGWELAASFKSLPASSQVPVILLDSQLKWFQIFRKASGRDPDAVLAKPFWTPTLSHAITRALVHRASHLNSILLISDSSRSSTIGAMVERVKGKFWKELDHCPTVSEILGLLSRRHSKTGLLVVDAAWVSRWSRRDISLLRKAIRSFGLLVVLLNSDGQQNDACRFPIDFSLNQSADPRKWRSVFRSAGWRRQWSWKIAQLVKSAKTLRNQGHFDDAVSLLRQATHLDRYNSNNQMMLGDLLKLRGSKRAAMGRYRQAFRFNPQTPFLVSRLNDAESKSVGESLR